MLRLHVCTYTQRYDRQLKILIDIALQEPVFTAKIPKDCMRWPVVRVRVRDNAASPKVSVKVKVLGTMPVRRIAGGEVVQVEM